MQMTNFHDSVENIKQKERRGNRNDRIIFLCFHAPKEVCLKAIKQF